MPARRTEVLYAIIAEDGSDSLPGRREARERHLARVTLLQDEGRLVLAGPHPALDTTEPGEAGFTGSLIVAEFTSLAAAESWAGEDPYVSAGVWRNVTVKPLIRVLP